MIIIMLKLLSLVCCVALPIIYEDKLNKIRKFNVGYSGKVVQVVK